jgi:hypothetical protein
MTTFNWTISAVGRAVSKDGLTDVIQTVHWRYRGINENGVTAETYGAATIGDPNPQDFTPFTEVTSADVQGWLESILDVPSIQANLQAQIDLLVTPTTITGPLHSAPVVEVEEVEETIVVEEESV